MLEEKFKKLIEQSSEKLIFHQEDKKRIRQNLISFISEAAAPVAHTPPQARLPFWGLARQFALQYSMVAIAVIALSGIGVSAAAQNALPGELLYPVKTNVNEKIAGWAKFSDKAKAEHEIGLVQLRLEEIEKVAAKDALDGRIGDRAKVLLDKHVGDVKSRVEKLKHQGQVNVGIEANSKLEASLNAHGGILGKLAERKEAKASANINNVLLKVKEKADETILQRQNDESQLAEQHSLKMQVLAEQKLQEAGRSIEIALQFFANHKAELSVDSAIKAQAELSVASDAYAQGKAKMDAQEYQGAFVLFQQTLRLTQQVKTSVSTETQFKLQLNL